MMMLSDIYKINVPSKLLKDEIFRAALLLEINSRCEDLTGQKLKEGDCCFEIDPKELIVEVNPVTYNITICSWVHDFEITGNLMFAIQIIIEEIMLFGNEVLTA